MRLLITGGAGYIGSHMARWMLDRGATVDVYDNLVQGHREAVDPRAGWIEGDVRDATRLGRVLAEGRYDGCFHFAALTLVGDSFAQEALYREVNTGGTALLARLLVEHGCRALVMSSTCAVYGDHGPVPLHEGFGLAPMSPYGDSKRAAEDAALAVEGLSLARLRYFNAAGAHPDGSLGEAHQPETHLIPLAIAAACGERDPLAIFGEDYPTPDGTCIRDYVHVLDLVAAHESALAWLRAGRGSRIWNIGSGTGHSVRAVLDAVGRAVGRPVPCHSAPRRPGDPPMLVADPARARAELGWAPARDLLACARDAWNWHGGGGYSAGGDTGNGSGAGRPGSAS